MSPGNVHVDLEVVNGSFDDRAYLIEVVSFFRIPLDTDSNKFYRVTEAGDWSILSYDEEN